MNSQPTSDLPRITPEMPMVDAQCEKHGAYRAKQIPSFMGHPPITMSCPTCSAEKRAAAEHERIEAEARARASRVQLLFNRAGIPMRIASRTLGNYQAETAPQKRALKIAQRFVESCDEGSVAGASLVLAGKPGTGKTHIACGIGRALMEETRSVLFMTVLQALRHIKDTYRRDSEKSESDAIKDMLRPDLLILDEIGAQLGSEHEKMLMFEIINERYQQCRSTILISNLTGEELTAFLGDRVMDRFRESGALVAFDWSSYRGKRLDA